MNSSRLDIRPKTNTFTLSDAVHLFFFTFYGIGGQEELQEELHPPSCDVFEKKNNFHVKCVFMPVASLS